MSRRSWWASRLNDSTVLRFLSKVDKLITIPSTLLMDVTLISRTVSNINQNKLDSTQQAGLLWITALKWMTVCRFRGNSLFQKNKTRSLYMNISQNSDIINSLINKNRASSFPLLQHLSEFRHNYVVDSEKQGQNLFTLLIRPTLPYDSIHVSYQNWNHGCSFISRQQMSLLAN